VLHDSERISADLPTRSEVNMKRFCTSRLAVVLSAVALTFLRVHQLHAQAATLTGRVMSESGQPVENGNVFITELNLSVGTNAQGRYSLVIPAERVRNQAVVLRARAIGHLAQAKPLTLRAGAQTNDFELKRDINRLQEVIVTGVTGATEQRKTTFAVTALNEQDLAVKPANALASIAGKVPGATVTGSNGRPGTAPSIVLRGAHSINATNRDQGPLVIVDGILLNGNSTDIDPEDIESIEIVKGAAGASIYGSRAQNGVISIKTKRGVDAGGGVKINARQETGTDDIQGSYPFPTRHMIMMNEDNNRFCVKNTAFPTCSRTLDWDTEVLRINDVLTPYVLTSNPLERDYGLSNNPSKGELKGLFEVNQWPRSYNPIDRIKTNQLHSNSTVDLTGKTGGTGYYMSFNNFIQQGAVRNQQGYNRQSARANLDQTVGSDVNLSLQMGYTRSQQYPDQFGWFGLTREHAAANLLGTDSRGRIFYRPDISATTGSQPQNNNPLYFAQATTGRTDVSRFLGSFTAHYNVTDWLSLESTSSMDERRQNTVSLTDKGYRSITVGDAASLGNMSARENNDLSYNVLLDAALSHTFGRDITTRTDFRYTFEDQEANNVGGSGSTLTLQGLKDLGNVTTSLNPTYGTTSQRALSGSVAEAISFKDRYFFDGSVRKDGSSLFGEDQRYHNYYRASLAWLLSDEPWFPAPNMIDQFKLRAAVGTAGARPSFAAQYEVLTIGTGGAITANTLGNKNLRPENTLETEYGIDAEFFHKYGLNVTYARDITTDELLLVPASVSSGFSNQWRNAGTMDGRTWEVSLNVPILAKKSFVWTSRFNWDQNRAYITSLDVPEYYNSVTNSNIRFAVGERYGNIYGHQFVTKCSQLPGDFQSRCGSGKEWQANDQGYIVWVGAGNSYKDGVTKNLWQSMTGGCVVNGVVSGAIQGINNCIAAGGTVNTPWGQKQVHWGMLTAMRDSNGAEQNRLLGNSMPLWKIGWSHNVQYKRASAYILLDKTFGNKVYNEDREWSFGDFMTSDAQQNGKSVEDAKPIGYYWRSTAPESGAGVGGYYDVIGPNTISLEDASYVKVRELSLTYNVGAIKHVAGNWSLTATGRNLYTWTKYTGWDPDTGASGGSSNQIQSGALFSAQSSSYPQTRNFTLTLSSKF
jgi:TonB-linked SusC/RagA family outer membrane protein